ncbi:hypothetical protein JTE90_026596 [Oedothorax gibbosus]|uniref:Uncharacterized protein n=1 Tax=Oedothorax gibbosus TaxID=931172 RepID=A0AAV6TDU3_9ARAC|nr:hypothetical protein JTE90_026596 [Oedothorax gibbosus]
MGAIVTGGAGNFASLRLIIAKDLECKLITNYGSQKSPVIVIFSSLLPFPGVGNLRACCLPVLVAVSQASLFRNANPDIPSPRYDHGKRITYHSTLIGRHLNEYVRRDEARAIKQQP